jgi:hypothetical protein
MELKKLSFILSLVVLFVGFACKKTKKDTIKNDQYANASSDSCSCEANWFPHTDTPPPMEGPGSPFDTSSTTNCIFHQWSWQKFLWLTKPLSNGHPLFQDSLMQVDASMAPVAPYQNVKLVLEDTAQAGSGGSLYTNPAYSTDSSRHLVYYSIFVNNTLMDAANTFKTMILGDTSKINNMNDFPTGSLELKVSWVDINSIAANQQASYYTTQAAIKTGSTYQMITVALLGMHVVGRVINHPEFIWATFEHQDMGPYYNWQNTTTSQDAPIASTTDKLLFAKDSTTGLGGITWPIPSAADQFKVYSLYKYGVPRTAQNAFLSGTSQTEPLNYDNIDGLNTCVAANLATTDVWRNYFYNGSIWVNTDGLTPTQQDSMVVAQGSNIGNGTTGSVARGSLNVFNLTMETYVQTQASNTPNVIHTIGVSDLFNCFTCHSAAPFVLKVNGVNYKGKRSPLYVSHIFRNYLNSSGNTSNNTILNAAKRQGVLDFIETLKAKKKK